MANSDGGRKFKEIGVTDTKDKCVITLTVPGMVTKKKTFGERKATNTEINPDIQDRSVCITATVTKDDSTRTFRYERQLPSDVNKTYKLAVEEKQLRLTLTKMSQGLWTSDLDYLHYRKN